MTQTNPTGSEQEMQRFYGARNHAIVSLVAWRLIERWRLSSRPRASVRPLADSEPRSEMELVGRRTLVWRYRPPGAPLNAIFRRRYWRLHRGMGPR